MKRTMLAVAFLLVAGIAAPHAQPLLPFPTDIAPAVSSDTASSGAVADIEAAHRFAWILNPVADVPPSGMGGLRLLYDIGLEFRIAGLLAAQVDAIAAALAVEPAIPHERLAAAGNSVELTLGGAAPATEAQLADAAARLAPLRNPLPGGAFEYDIAMSGGFFRLSLTEAGLAYRTAELLDATIAAIGRRLARLDVAATARSQGDDRIVITLAGPEVAEARAAIEDGDALVSLHLVNREPRFALPDPLPAGTMAVPDRIDPSRVYLLAEEPIVGFTGFARAEASMDPASHMPIVRFDLTDEAARAFATVTAANIGRMLAVVVDGVVVSSPVIRSAIAGGTGVIAGNFTMAEASDLAEAIRAGGLPAPVTLVETRTIDDAFPVASPAMNRGALAVELMTENGAVTLPWEIAVSAYWLGLGKAGVQRLDGDDRFAVLTVRMPDGGEHGRAIALELLRKQLAGLYSIRAVWEIGPLLVLERDVGFVPG